MSKSQVCGMTDESGDKLCGCSPVGKCLNHYSLKKTNLVFCLQYWDLFK